jgi:hypothetical protein
VKPVRFVEEAQDEFLEQIAFYEEREKGLGERFRLPVQAATTLAATHPNSVRLRSFVLEEYFPRASASRWSIA